MYVKERKAFTMIELIIVITIIGILSAIAIPKLAITKNGAVITKAKTTIASVRSALATERQKRILQGKFTDLNQTAIGTNFIHLLEHKVKGCSSPGCDGWQTGGSATTPTYTFYGSEGTVVFRLIKNRLVCDTSAPNPNHCAKYE